MFILDNKQIQLDTAFDHNDIQYPANWLRLASVKEREAIGITEQPDPVVVVPKRDVSELKKQAIENVKQAARNELSKSDWMVIRKVELNIEIPKHVVQERSRIHAWADSAEKQITSATSEEQLQAVNMNPEPVAPKAVTK